MKEHIPTIIIVSLALIWSESRYQQLFSRLEKIEQNSNGNNATNSNQNHVKRTKNRKSPFQDSHQTNTKTVRSASKNGKNPKEKTIKNEVKKSVSLDLDNPDVQEELYQFLEEREKEQKEIKRAEGIGQYLDYIDRRIETYAQDHQLPSSVSQAVMLEIQERTNEYATVEHAAEDGEIDWSEAKPEMERIKEEGKINLTNILGGEEEYQEFERFVWGKE